MTHTHLYPSPAQNTDDMKMNIKAASVKADVTQGKALFYVHGAIKWHFSHVKQLYM